MNANPKLFRNFRQNITASTPTTLQIPQALNNFTKENCIFSEIKKCLLLATAGTLMNKGLNKTKQRIYKQRIRHLTKHCLV